MSTHRVVHCTESAVNLSAFDRRKTRLLEYNSVYSLVDNHPMFWKQNQLGFVSTRNDLEPSSCPSFQCIAIISCIIHWKIRCISCEQSRKYIMIFESCLIFVDVTVHETVHHCRMSMNINEEIEFIILENIIIRNKNKNKKENCFFFICLPPLKVTRSIPKEKEQTWLVLKFMMCVFVPWISGCAHNDGSFQTRFKSNPSNEHLTRVWSNVCV